MTLNPALRWVPNEVGGGSCPNMTCTTPMSLLSFESFIRVWFSELVSDADGVNATAAAATIRVKLSGIGFPSDQAEEMAAALAAQPQAAASFAQMPLTDLLKLVPPGALTRDVFHIGGGAALFSCNVFFLHLSSPTAQFLMRDASYLKYWWLFRSLSRL